MNNKNLISLKLEEKVVNVLNAGVKHYLNLNQFLIKTK